MKGRGVGPRIFRRDRGGGAVTKIHFSPKTTRGKKSEKKSHLASSWFHRHRLKVKKKGFKTNMGNLPIKKKKKKKKQKKTLYTSKKGTATSTTTVSSKDKQ